MKFSIQILDAAGETGIDEVEQAPHAIIAHLKGYDWGHQPSGEDALRDQFGVAGK